MFSLPISLHGYDTLYFQSRFKYYKIPIENNHSWLKYKYNQLKTKIENSKIRISRTISWRLQHLILPLHFLLVTTTRLLSTRSSKYFYAVSSNSLDKNGFAKLSAIHNLIRYVTFIYIIIFRRSSHL